jgi:hypothetical protein
MPDLFGTIVNWEWDAPYAVAAFLGTIKGRLVRSPSTMAPCGFT